MRLILTALVFCLTLVPMATEAQVLLPKNKESGFMGLLPDFMKPKPEPEPTAKKNITPRRVAPPVAPKSAIAPTLPTINTTNEPLTLDSFNFPNNTSNNSGNFIQTFESLVSQKLMNSMPPGFDKIMNQQMNVIREQMSPQNNGLSGFNLGGLTQSSQGPISITPGGIVPPEFMQDENNLAEAKKQASPKTLKILNNMKKLSSAFEEKKLRKRNPQQLLMPDIIPQTNTNKDLKNIVSFSSIPNYLWGKRDLQMINQSLGYEKIEVPKNCQIRHIVKIKTNDPQVPNNNGVLWGEKSMALKYNGTLQSASFDSLAVCYKPEKRPPFSSIMIQVGDKMGVVLPGDGVCKPPKNLSYVNKIYVKYTGDGKVICKFE